MNDHREHPKVRTLRFFIHPIVTMGAEMYKTGFHRGLTGARTIVAVTALQQHNTYRIEKHIKDYIDADQCLTAKLDDVAKQFNYSKYYLDRCFKESYGVGIMAYRNKKRLQTAKEMLKEHSVSVVAEKLGFSSIYVFSRAFKNHFGVSPTQNKKAR